MSIGNCEPPGNVEKVEFTNKNSSANLDATQWEQSSSVIRAESLKFWDITNNIKPTRSRYESGKNKVWSRCNFTKLNGRRSQFDDNPPYAQLRAQRIISNMRKCAIFSVLYEIDVSHFFKQKILGHDPNTSLLKYILKC